MKNEMELKLKAVSQNESFARVVAAAFSSQLDPTIGEISDIKTAVSEAVTNAIIHANSPDGFVALKLTLDGRKLTVVVEDNGRGIEDVGLAMSPFYTTGNTEERSGMGFTVMQTFMDKVSVVSAPGQGTTVTMTKKIGE